MKFTRQPATVVVLVDQSLSMDNPFGDGTRWTVLRDALLSPDKGIIKKLEAEVRFGLALYTGVSGQTCPLLDEVSVGLGQYATIKATFDAAKPTDNTPTGESLKAVAAKLAADPDPSSKHIVLATDGNPDTCAVPNPSTTAEKDAARALSVAAAKGAFDSKIQVHVISVGKDVGPGHLQDVANAGAGLAVGGAQNAPFFVADDQAKLTSALTKIIYGARSCVFALNGTVNAGAEGSGAVSIDGKAVPFDGKDGWKLKSPSQVELVGASCQAIQGGEPSVSISFPCGAVEIIK